MDDYGDFRDRIVREPGEVIALWDHEHNWLTNSVDGIEIRICLWCDCAEAREIEPSDG